LRQPNIIRIKLFSTQNVNFCCSRK
jgi:hypothetical protein